MKNAYLRNLIKQHKSKFSSSEQNLADYFLSLNEKDLINKTISELSVESGISQTTIFNFVKKLGFTGFQKFKIELASNSDAQTQHQNTISAFSDITSQDSSWDVAQKIIHFNQESLANLINSLDKQTLEGTLQLLDQSKSIHFFGQGGSSVVAFDAYHKFIRSQYYCNYIADYHIQLSYATKLGPHDCAFLFSHTGDTQETLQLAKILKETGCKIISLTGNPTSHLIDYSDETFIIFSEESKFRTESLTSRILYLTVMDIIYTIIMYRNEEQSSQSLERIRSALKITRL
ncbi:MurR/RpiR family transcriptional regulator [Vaginisenegalia massiliensis]|uniref:MurR/RpiR family transcriptional regulator n=1 Tax=Vaginisenegalia massiliensis TaxID=2058294 RepID=UPI000F527548|nr:MurR/RpiR family transcriptional regulator [Vaginisenegalia massiliensis]